jgi:isopenicillin-N N-acyltransferase-like protein
MRTLDVLRARGDPGERGRAIGSGFRDAIGASCDFYRGYFARRGLEGEDLETAARPFVDAADRGLPAWMQMLRGMAEGARVAFIDLFVPNAFEELAPLLPDAPAGERPGRRIERCSDVTIVDAGVTLLGHNENWLAADVGRVGVVIELPSESGGIPLASPTGVCFPPAVGMNAAGAAVGVMSLTAPDDGVGVPRVLVSREALGSTSREDALRRTAPAGRSGGYGYSFALAGGRAFTIETTASRQAVIDGPGVHTNHYLDASLAEVGSPASPESLGRYERLASLVRERRPRTPAELMAMLADHASSPEAVCTHPDAADGDEASAVLFSMVCDLEAGRMWVAPGNPCETAYEEVDLAEVI